jgi:hypothetical protein
MTADEVAAAVNKGFRRFRISDPSVGYVGGSRLALRAFADGNKLAMFTGAENDPSLFVLDEIQALGPDFVAKVVRPFPAPLLVVSQINPLDSNYKSWADAAESLHEFYGDDWATLEATARAAMDRLQVWTEPPRTTTVHYMTWFESSANKDFHGARGIVALSEDGKKLVARTFPGREDEAEQWSHWINLPPNPFRALSAVADSVGRNTLLSEPREFHGHSWEDAAARALHAYAAEIYEATNRSMFS